MEVVRTITSLTTGADDLKCSVLLFNSAKYTDRDSAEKKKRSNPAVSIT